MSIAVQQHTFLTHLVGSVVTRTSVCLIGNENMPKIIINDNEFVVFKLAISILVISNHNIFRVLLGIVASVYFISEKYLYSSIGNGQPMEPALCQL